MSGRIHKSRIPIRSIRELPEGVKKELILAKQKVFIEIGLKSFNNERGAIGDGPPLPQLPNGSIYIECQLGKAHPEDPRQAGRCRVVFEVHSLTRRIMEIYYTDDHYAKFSFYRLF